MSDQSLEKDPEHRNATDTLSIAQAVTAPGIDTEVMQDIYTRWAKGYDSDLQNVDYEGPRQLAEVVAEFVEEQKRTEVRILDFGAGTGLGGDCLAKKGFHNIDALEPNSTMLQVAMDKNVYQRGIHAYLLATQTLDIEDNAYDFAVSVGCFNEGHIKSDCFSELIRITKPGGRIFFAISEKSLKCIPEFRDKLMPSLKALEETNHLVIEEIREMLLEYFLGSKGFIYCLRVL